MKDWLVEAFERKLHAIIDNNGINGDGKVTVNAEDLLLMIRLYKHQITTIEQLDNRIEKLQQFNNNLEGVVAWQLRYEAVNRECNKAIEDYNEIWRIYTQILHDGILMKRKLNRLSAQNEIMLEAITAIANAQVDDADDIIQYAGAVLETFKKDS